MILLSKRDLNEYDEFSPSNIDPELEDLDWDKIIPGEEIYILPLRNGVLFPKVTLPIFLEREYSQELIDEAERDGLHIGVVAQKSPLIENPDIKDLYEYGTVATLVKREKKFGLDETAVLFGLTRFKIIKKISDKPFLKVKVKYLKDVIPIEKSDKFEQNLKMIKILVYDLMHLSINLTEDVIKQVMKFDSAEMFINMLITGFDLDIEEKIEMLRTDNLEERADKLLNSFLREVEKQEIREKIASKVRKQIDQQQREYYLQQELKAIQKELGIESPNKKDIDELKEKAKKKKWSKKVEEIFFKELSRLENIPNISPEYGVQINYLKTLLDLPWDHKTKDNYDLERAKKILDQDHYGLEKVKERILEYLAVLKLNKGNLKSPIILLYGPPGVGKTSLGQSIAKALNRKFVRMSLGGLHDEAEIRGHRKTYIGAMPGRIIQNIKRAQASNPVFVLDEIDKVGSDFRGDPASALLEVLDPEQNHAFYDNYLEIEYDLSDVLFIATANTLSTISPPLLDRMEIIEVTGYVLEEKIEIAKRHLIPKQLAAHGLKRRKIIFTDESLKFLIENYTKESGVRELDKKIAAIIRKVAKKIAFGHKGKFEITPGQIQEFLGSPKFQNSSYEVPEIAGVVPGLAWTPTGGELLYIEASISRGTGRLTLTGNLGDIMKESATLGLEYIKSHYSDLKIHPLIFKYWNIHLHVPEGAIPKDGPSAGITMATAIASAFTQRKVKPYLAMTGELTLSGKVLPVGGIKEKILAAKRSGIKEVILSEKNKPDVEEIKEIYRKGLKFHYINTMEEVLKIALLDEKVKNPLKIGIPKNEIKKINGKNC